MEDPLFDPWGDVGESAPDEATASVRPSSSLDAELETIKPSQAPSDAPASAPRWRAVTGRPTPLARPAPKMIVDMDDAPARPLPTQGKEAASQTVPEEHLPVAMPVELPAPAPHGATLRLDESVRGVTPVKTVVLPALRALRQRLELARHDVRIDDRTDRMPASVRFQLRPWAGPFDDATAGSAPVLEFVDEAGGDQLAVRTWLEPMAKEPSTARVIPSQRVERRLRRILLDFVEASLAG